MKRYIHIKHAKVVIRLKALCRRNPIDSWRVQRITCTIEPHQTIKKKVTPHLKACPVAFPCTLDSGLSLKQRWTKSCCRGFRLCKTLRNQVSPRHCGQLCNKWSRRKKVNPRYSGQWFNQRHDVWDRKKANCFTLLKRIARLKCVNSEIKSNVQIST